MCACTALSRESVAHFGLTFKLTLSFSLVCVCVDRPLPLLKTSVFLCTRFVFLHRPIINKNPCFIHFVPSSFNPGLNTRVASPQPLGLWGCNTQKQKNILPQLIATFTYLPRRFQMQLESHCCPLGTQALLEA